MMYSCSNVTILLSIKIGVGSVITKDISCNSLAYGNPCKVVREINENDSKKYKKELFKGAKINN